MGDNGKTAMGRALMINACHCSCKYCSLSARASNAVIVFSNGRLSIEIVPIESKNQNEKMTRLNEAVLYQFNRICDALNRDRI
jgi:pyruvate formate-lyase activating enzyme-like uncharacterized protein